MHFEGSLEVLRRLLLKKHLMERGDPLHQAIRPALIILAGGMRGVYSGGQVTALEQHGLSQVFTLVKGSSAGSCSGLYFVAGQAALGTSIYYEECTTAAFISARRFLQGKPLMDIDYLCKIFRGEIGNKKVDLEAVARNPAELLVTATRRTDGEVVLLDAKNIAPDPIEAVRASMAMPGFSHGEVVIDGVSYLDGAALHLPFRHALETHGATDLLVLGNDTQRGWATTALQERVVLPFLTAQYPRPVRRAFARRRSEVLQDLASLLTHKTCRCAVIWSDSDEIGVFERHAGKLRAAATKANNHLSRLLTEAAAPV